MLLDVPEPPVNLTDIVITSRNVTLTWVEPHDNNAPITQYQVSYVAPVFLEGQEVSALTVDDTEMITIADLHPGETYTFTVIAINEEGNSDMSAPLTIRTLEEGIKLHVHVLCTDRDTCTCNYNSVVHVHVVY